jgi:hypothetical protein
MTTSDIRAQLSRLPAVPTIDDLRPIARNLAIVASARDHPLKSLAAFQRHNIDLSHLDAVLELVQDELASLKAREHGVTAAPVPTMRWLGVEATASLLPNTSVAAIKERLRSRQGRYSLGWAWWDGYRWLIPEPAINPATRAGYMGTIPEREPEAHVATLPDWAHQ